MPCVVNTAYINEQFFYLYNFPKHWRKRCYNFVPKHTTATFFFIYLLHLSYENTPSKIACVLCPDSLMCFCIGLSCLDCLAIHTLRNDVGRQTQIHTRNVYLRKHFYCSQSHFLVPVVARTPLVLLGSICSFLPEYHRQCRVHQFLRKGHLYTRYRPCLLVWALVSTPKKAIALPTVRRQGD